MDAGKEKEQPLSSLPTAFRSSVHLTTVASAIRGEETEPERAYPLLLTNPNPQPLPQSPAVLCGGGIWNLLAVTQATQGRRVLIGCCQ